jgi:hypothetical protein
MKQSEFDKKIKFEYQTIPLNSEIAFDGILDEEEYAKQEIKLLWILKESYGEAIEFENRENLLKDEKYLTYPTWDSIIKVTYAIINNLQNLDTHLSTNEKQSVLKKIAFINIKKNSGESKSIEKEIENHFNLNSILLVDQINFINPDIIICGNTLHHFIDKNAFDLKCDAEINHEDLGVWYRYKHNKLFIAGMHPSSIGYKNYSGLPILNTVNYFNSQIKNK